jgi:hypothetical protein
MTVAESVVEFSEQPTLSALTQLLIEQTRETVAGANAFRHWTQARLMLREPSDAKLKEHDQVCKKLISALRFSQIVLSDPVFPDKPFAEEVAFTIRRLTEDWEMLHGAMPEAEARQLIPDLFAA